MDLSILIQEALSFLPDAAMDNMQAEVEKAQNTLLQGTGPGNDFLGWIKWPSTINPEIIDKVNETAKRIRDIAEVLVVIGIGGSYLGARAVIDALGTTYPWNQKGYKKLQILYAGENLSEEAMADLLDLLYDKKYAIAVISKSGTTTEPAVAFRLLKAHLEKLTGPVEAKQRIIAITDASKGALKKLADQEGYTTFVIPDDIGGRYSVLTPVGLLPIAAAGYDIAAILEGASVMEHTLTQSSAYADNPAAVYAAIRNLLYRAGKNIEIMVTWQPHLVMLTEWWKQLYGESEGKEGKGIFPAGVTFTTDLHSMGQFIQEGTRNLFETVLTVEQPRREVRIPEDPDNIDGLNYLAGKRISEVNREAINGTRMAHIDGGVPNISISIPERSEYIIGQLLYFYEYACGLSGYILGINPFNQPGVEAYKKNMFQLLGKPGY
jgi:glucose-6-phosphate isomerase